MFYDAYKSWNEEEEEEENDLEKKLIPESQAVGWCKAYWKTFGLVGLAEWGDRTQIASLTISAKTSAVPVIIGGGFAYAVCALLAVLVGKLVSNYLSEKVMSLIGGIVFLVFGILTAIFG